MEHTASDGRSLSRYFLLLFGLHGGRPSPVGLDLQQITAVAAILYVLVVVYLWGPKTLARFGFGHR